MKKLTIAWVRKAESDFAVASKLSRGRESHPDEVCFRAQQSAEKYLKALLEDLGQPVPRTHILEHLVVAPLPFHPRLAITQARKQVPNLLCRRNTLSRLKRNEASSCLRAAVGREVSRCWPRLAQSASAQTKGAPNSLKETQGRSIIACSDREL